MVLGTGRLSFLQAASLATLTLSAAPAWPSEPAEFRIGLSIATIGEINRNDARASILAWGRAILSQNGIVAETRSSIFERSEDLFLALREKRMDAASVLTLELLADPTTQAPDEVFLFVANGKTTEQYVLLTHQAAAIHDLASLQGSSLEMHTSARTSLGGAWLDALFARRGLGLAERVFRTTNHNEKASRTINRVFFRQADACVVTRSAFETAGNSTPRFGESFGFWRPRRKSSRRSSSSGVTFRWTCAGESRRPS